MTTKKRKSPLILRCAANIKAARLRRGLSQEKLAGVASMHRTYIGAIERGERNITMEILEKISIALDVDPAILLENKEK